jgi:hypothetical protein|tara:strand:- start:675 stop:953 length:279 start_codon:yes stop_codon:yes gene_type:complete
MTERKCIFNTILDEIAKTIRKLFGEPNTGIHSYRVFNIAYMDVIITIIGAFVIQKILFPKTKYLKVLFLFFILGIVLHRLFDVKTTIDKLLF